jgi:hypothetical protein
MKNTSPSRINRGRIQGMEFALLRCGRGRLRAAAADDDPAPGRRSEVLFEEACIFWSGVAVGLFLGAAIGMVVASLLTATGSMIALVSTIADRPQTAPMDQCGKTPRLDDGNMFHPLDPVFDQRDYPGAGVNKDLRELHLGDVVHFAQDFNLLSHDFSHILASQFLRYTGFF